MRTHKPPLSPADRRSLAADLLARRLLEIASRGLLLPDEEDAAEPPVRVDARAPREVTDGAR